MEFTAEVWFILISAIGATLCVGALAGRLPAGERVFERSLRPRPESDVWPAQLVRIEQTVGWASASARDAHTRLRPLLVEIAEARLARRGLRLDRDRDRVRDLIGPTAWELVRPGRPEPRDPDAPGIAPRDLAAILDALEAL